MWVFLFVFVKTGDVNSQHVGERERVRFQAFFGVGLGVVLEPDSPFSVLSIPEETRHSLLQARERGGGYFFADCTLSQFSP